MRRLLAVLFLALVLLPRDADACLWDSDTLETEAAGMPEVIDVITGRFPRNPPLYYEMRLAHAQKLVAADAANLDAYDDAGVSCDRLGRGDEAIEWMEKKRAQLDKLDPKAARTLDHRYRYLANLGTFHAHRWVRDGADRARISEMEKAAALIKEAIALNPDAHFGREKYQLMALDWIIQAPANRLSFVPRDAMARSSSTTKRGQSANSEAIKGISGIVTLGDGWASIDALGALRQVLVADGRAALADLARLRMLEIEKSGKRSLVHPRMAVSDLCRGLEEPELLDTEVRKNARFFAKTRASADAWHQARTDYTMERLNAGRHPDWDKSFWDVYREAKAPKPAPAKSKSPQ